MSSPFASDNLHPDLASVAAVSALDEPARRRLYDYVCGRCEPVSRDEAAEALAMPRQTAAFHLDKLADVGLLSVEFARLTGRSGPGAGRPAKLYRRAEHDIAVQLPERSYELAGLLLAQAVDDSERTGQTPREALAGGAAALGRTLGAELGRGAAVTDGDLIAVLERCGYEPRVEGEDIALVNCPFHALAQQHTALVCGMNLDLIDGILDGAGCAGRKATLAPQECYCCVRIGPTR